MKNRFAPKKKTSDCQDRIEVMPELFAEFQTLERAQNGTYLHFRLERDAEHATEKRMTYLDKVLGFEGESQMRKVGVEPSHWANRKAHA